MELAAHTLDFELQSMAHVQHLLPHVMSQFGHLLPQVMPQFRHVLTQQQRILLRGERIARTASVNGGFCLDSLSEPTRAD